ncbi:MAG: hypothetical protein WCY37_05165 [Candidatus Dojkabacteria bacterium]
MLNFDGLFAGQYQGFGGINVKFADLTTTPIPAVSNGRSGGSGDNNESSEYTPDGLIGANRYATNEWMRNNETMKQGKNMMNEGYNKLATLGGNIKEEEYNAIQQQIRRGKQLYNDAKYNNTYLETNSNSLIKQKENETKLHANTSNNDNLVALTKGNTPTQYAMVDKNTPLNQVGMFTYGDVFKYNEEYAYLDETYTPRLPLQNQLFISNTVNYKGTVNSIVDGLKNLSNTANIDFWKGKDGYDETRGISAMALGNIPILINDIRYDDIRSNENQLNSFYNNWKNLLSADELTQATADAHTKFEQGEAVSSAEIISKKDGETDEDYEARKKAIIAEHRRMGFSATIHKTEEGDDMLSTYFNKDTATYKNVYDVIDGNDVTKYTKDSDGNFVETTDDLKEYYVEGADGKYYKANKDGFLIDENGYNIPRTVGEASNIIESIPGIYLSNDIKGTIEPYRQLQQELNHTRFISKLSGDGVTVNIDNTEKVLEKITYPAYALVVTGVGKEMGTYNIGGRIGTSKVDVRTFAADVKNEKVDMGFNMYKNGYAVSGDGTFYPLSIDSAGKFGEGWQTLQWTGKSAELPAVYSKTEAVEDVFNNTGQFFTTIGLSEHIGKLFNNSSDTANSAKWLQSDSYLPVWGSEEEIIIDGDVIIGGDVKNIFDFDENVPGYDKEAHEMYLEREKEIAEAKKIQKTIPFFPIPKDLKEDKEFQVYNKLDDLHALKLINDEEYDLFRYVFGDKDLADLRDKIITQRNKSADYTLVANDYYRYSSNIRKKAIKSGMTEDKADDIADWLIYTMEAKLQRKTNPEGAFNMPWNLLNNPQKFSGSQIKPWDARYRGGNDSWNTFVSNEAGEHQWAKPFIGVKVYKHFKPQLSSKGTYDVDDIQKIINTLPVFTKYQTDGITIGNIVKGSDKNLEKIVKEAAELIKSAKVPGDEQELELYDALVYIRDEFAKEKVFINIPYERYSNADAAPGKGTTASAALDSKFILTMTMYTDMDLESATGGYEASSGWVTNIRNTSSMDMTQNDIFKEVTERLINYSNN